MERTYAHVGEAIKARREALGYTQRGLCERLGWKRQRQTEISDLEVGINKNPTLARLIDLARALDCHVSDLVSMLDTESLAA